MRIWQYIYCAVNGKKFNQNRTLVTSELTENVSLYHKSKKNWQHKGTKVKNKQRFTKHTHKTKDRVTRTPLKYI